MKIIVASLVSHHNFGTVFQNYALTKYLSKLGYDSYLLNYLWRFDKEKHPLVPKIKFHILWFLINRIIFLKRYRFKKFLKRNIRFTKRYKTSSALRKNPPESDVYLIGSDQVWNPIFNTNGVFFLRWVRKGFKMSYSSSIGESKLSKEVLDDMCDALKDFKYIAVREDTGQKMLTEAGIPDVTHVMDPVFLLDANEYETLLNPNKYGKYILVISYEKNDITNKVLKKLKDRTGLKVIEFGHFTQEFIDIADKFLKNIGPEEIISLIKNAEIVVTTSFHVTAFSLIFNVNFVPVLSNYTPSRQTSLLKICGLEERAIGKGNIIDAEKLLEAPDWTSVNNKLKKKITESKEWLKQALKDCERSLQ